MLCDTLYLYRARHCRSVQEQEGYLPAGERRRWWRLGGEAGGREDDGSTLRGRMLQTEQAWNEDLLREVALREASEDREKEVAELTVFAFQRGQGQGEDLSQASLDI